MAIAVREQRVPFLTVGFFLILSLCSLASPVALAQSNILTYHNDNMRTGQNLNEVILTPANVSSSRFGKLFSVTMDGDVDAEPLVVSGLNMPGVGLAMSFFPQRSTTAFTLSMRTRAFSIGKSVFCSRVKPVPTRVAAFR